MLATQSALVEEMRQELASLKPHPHFAEGGVFYKKKPQDIDTKDVIAEIDKMMAGAKDAAYYEAYQPVLNGVKKSDPAFATEQGELLPTWASNFLKKFHCCHRRQDSEEAPTRCIKTPRRQLEEDWEEAPEMYLEGFEQLLRGEDGGVTQAYPIAVAYHLPAKNRQDLSLWQTRQGLERATECKKIVQVNWWQQDLEVCQDEVIEIAGGENVGIEWTSFAKVVDEPGFPTQAIFDNKTIQLMAKFKANGVKNILDDVNNWTHNEYPCTFEFALAVAAFLYQVKLDLKACAQAYHTLPNIHNAHLAAPLEHDEDARAVKAQRLVVFVEEMRNRNTNIILVIELSVCSHTLANKFPTFNPFVANWVWVQGGKTNNWAMKWQGERSTQSDP